VSDVLILPILVLIALGGVSAQYGLFRLPDPAAFPALGLAVCCFVMAAALSPIWPK
jgi:hypothetical protein